MRLAKAAGLVHSMQKCNAARAMVAARWRILQSGISAVTARDREAWVFSAHAAKIPFISARCALFAVVVAG